MQVGDPASDGEAQSGAAATIVRGERPERLERPLPVGRGDTRALVVHVEEVMVALPGRRDRDRAAGRAVPRRVVEEVGDELPEPGRVGVDDEVRGVDLYVVLDLAAEHPRLGDGVVEQRPDVHGLRAERRLPGVHARKIEKILDKFACPFGLLERSGQRLRVARGDTVDEVLEHGAQPSQRRTELVADVGDELTALPVDCGQVAGHGVEGPGQVAHLVPRGVGHPHGVVARRHPAGGGGHLPQRRRHAHGEELGDRQREQDRDRDAEPRGYAAGAPRLATTAATVTLAATSRPSLTFSEVTRASGCAVMPVRRARRRSRRRGPYGSGRRRAWRAAP